MSEHVDPCWGGHIPSVSCEEATAVREEERRKLFHCPNNPDGEGTHAFSGGTSCDYGCGRYLQELVPEENIGEYE